MVAYHYHYGIFLGSVKWAQNEIEFNNYEKKLIIDTHFTPDIYKFNKKYFYFPFVNFPIISQLDKINENLFLFNNFAHIESILKIKFKKITCQNIQIIKLYLFCTCISLIEKNDKKEINKIMQFVIDYLQYISLKFEKIFNFLSSKSKLKISNISIDRKSVV